MALRTSSLNTLVINILLLFIAFVLIRPFIDYLFGDPFEFIQTRRDYLKDLFLAIVIGYISWRYQILKKANK